MGTNIVCSHKFNFDFTKKVNQNAIWKKKSRKVLFAIVNPMQPSQLMVNGEL